MCIQAAGLSLVDYLGTSLIQDKSPERKALINKELPRNLNYENFTGWIAVQDFAIESEEQVTLLEKAYEAGFARAKLDEIDRAHTRELYNYSHGGF